MPYGHLYSLEGGVEREEEEGVEGGELQHLSHKPCLFGWLLKRRRDFKKGCGEHHPMSQAWRPVAVRISTTK